VSDSRGNPLEAHVLTSGLSTDGYLMLTGLQGVWTGKQYVLMPPTVLCERVRFGTTYLGSYSLRESYLALANKPEISVEAKKPVLRDL
jgi:hypothetical protein